MTTKMEIDYAILKENKRKSVRTIAQLTKVAMAVLGGSSILLGISFIGSAFVQNGVAAFTFLLGVMFMIATFFFMKAIRDVGKAHKRVTGEDL